MCGKEDVGIFGWFEQVTILVLPQDIISHARQVVIELPPT